jgi:hypothetical protein
MRISILDLGQVAKHLGEENHFHLLAGSERVCRLDSLVVRISPCNF